MVTMLFKTFYMQWNVLLIRLKTSPLVIHVSACGSRGGWNDKLKKFREAVLKEALLDNFEPQFLKCAF